MSSKNEPMHQRLSQKIRQEISSERWSAGVALPSELELSEQHGVSRGTVRQALASLRQEGLISGGRGKRPIVCPAVPSQPFESFMSFSEWATGMGRTPGQLTVEIARHHATEEVCEQLQIPIGESVVSLLRVRSLDGELTMLERSYYLREVGEQLFSMDLDSGSIFAFLRQRGVQLVRGRHIIDAVSADRVDARWLEVPQGAPLLRVRRTTMDESGRVLEVADDRYLPGQANFVIENSLAVRASQAHIALVV